MLYNAYSKSNTFFGRNKLYTTFLKQLLCIKTRKPLGGLSPPMSTSPTLNNMRN